MKTEAAAVVSRFISISEKLVSSVNSEKNPSQSVYKNMHEMQQIFLHLLAPYFKKIDVQESVVIDGYDSDLTAADILAGAVGELSSQGLQLTFGSGLEIIDKRLKRIMSGDTNFEAFTPN